MQPQAERSSKSDTGTSAKPLILFHSPLVITADPAVQPFISDVPVNTFTGLITQISKSIPQTADMQVIESEGMILCPGFIDMHAHSDLYLLTHPSHEAKISQGCTVSPGNPCDV
jgi:N-acyl-D-amino-acid deacylase